MTKFRKGVVGIFISSDNQVLLGERSQDPEMWQLPQGGMELGETILQTIKREMFEEVGVRDFNIIKHTKEFISYKWHSTAFPDSDYVGQEHIYFLLDGSSIRPSSLRPTEEFSRFKWVTINEALSIVIEFKRAVYTQAFRELELL